MLSLRPGSISHTTSGPQTLSRRPKTYQSTFSIYTTRPIRHMPNLFLVPRKEEQPGLVYRFSDLLSVCPLFLFLHLGSIVPLILGT